jgi:DNA-binding NtrC family response regulator
MAKILIIEDDENVNNILQQVLSSTGHEIVTITGCEHGLRLQS